jgi:hypothetical protein
MSINEDNVDVDAMRRRFDENFNALFNEPTKPRSPNMRKAPSQEKPATATPDKKSLCK